MSGLSEKMMYKEGENLLLDRELKSYRKMRLSRGDALNRSSLMMMSLKLLLS